MLIDIHAHIGDAKYLVKTEEIVKNFTAQGVGLVVDSGFDRASSEKAVQNAKKFDEVFCAIGVHPEKPLECDDEFEKFLEENSTFEKCVAIGEIGLDYHYEGFDRNLQMQAFERQIFLAERLRLPFVVHSRDASKDVCDLLYSCRNHIRHGFLMHCYSESIEQAKKYLDLGAFFSFGGVLTFKNSHRDEVAKSIPLDRVLTETDCPYLTPEPFRGQINYPQNVRFVYEKLSQIFGISPKTLEKTIESNATALLPKLGSYLQAK